MKELKNNLKKDTLKRVNDIFSLISIYENNNCLIIESKKSLTFEWAKFISKEIKTKCTFITYKTNF